ncbi:MAG: VOC family protein [Anaerolineae bacterium]
MRAFGVKITGIESVYVRVSDLDRAAQFYEKVLGLEVGDRTESAADFRPGDDRIGILHADAEGEKRVASPLVFLQVDDIDSAVQELREAGVTIVGSISLMEDLDESKIRVATFQDPDGNTLHLVEKGERAADS